MAFSNLNLNKNHWLSFFENPKHAGSPDWRTSSSSSGGSINFSLLDCSKWPESCSRSVKFHQNNVSTETLTWWSVLSLMSDHKLSIISSPDRSLTRSSFYFLLLLDFIHKLKLFRQNGAEWKWKFEFLLLLGDIALKWGLPARLWQFQFTSHLCIYLVYYKYIIIKSSLFFSAQSE